MEPILLYGHPSGSSMGLVAILEWLGMPYRVSRVDMMNEMRLPSYRRINPRVETPVLITNEGRVLTETSAIAAWLEVRDEQRRVSFDPRTPETDRMHQLTGFVNTGFTGAFSPLWFAMEMETPDPTVQNVLRRWGRENVIERHDRLEEMIGEAAFLISDRPSIADGVLIGVARWLDFHEVADRTRWPKLNAIRARLEADPAIVYATALENGESVTGSGVCLGHVALETVIERYGS